ncbi:hypothetical protein AB0E75_33160 [Streptomyces griseoviridis]|uniref:Uncharacterized protein n=1 Tax=Streptomyces griseoviridis TaxID=45398 RepID=A0A918GG91_STRGD|nr:hypothetical protein [Streptomyces niveoruber]GGS33789.1 hypothetical protein GCM10010238_23660 [Streptomyces niveoruber]
MSELLTAAQTIAPVITTAAAGFAGAVVQSAQNQAADSVVQRGRALVGRLLERRPEEPRDAGTDEAVEHIRALSEDERLALDRAVGTWLDARSAGRSADLRTLIEDEARAARPARRISARAVASGPGSIGIAYVENLGGLTQGTPARPPGEERREDGP